MAQILVVDDDPHVARALVDLLDLHGYTAVRAESGEQALDILSREPADLVLLDVRLPGISGFETCARIRERHGPSLPVVMLTAFGDPAAVRQGFDSGAEDVLSKPVDTRALILKVRAFLRLKALHDLSERNREEAQARVRALALLHEIGRDWSLIAEPEDFNRMVTERLASLIGAPICLLALYDSATRTLSAALPVFGLPDEQARTASYRVKPEHHGRWSLRSGRPYVSNRARGDPRLVQEMVEVVGAESLVLVPMLSEGMVLGFLAAANKPGGFTDADAQLLSIFAGPAATFIRSRQIFTRQRRHAARLERLSGLMGEMAATTGRGPLLELVVSRIQNDFACERVAFHAAEERGVLRLETEAGAAGEGGAAELLTFALKGTTPLRSSGAQGHELAVPVRAGDESLGVLSVSRAAPASFEEEEVSLLSAVAGQLAATLQKAASVAETERLARQMATLYDLGLETGALRDLRVLFSRAAQEAGRLIRADHASVFRLEASGLLRLFAAWARDPTREPYGAPEFRVGEGIAGRVARDGVPALVNEADAHDDFVPRGNPVARILCVPLSYFDQERDQQAVFGVLNATRLPGAPRFTHDDLDYLTRFASQLSIAVANSVALAAERERSEQLALVNSLLREIAGLFSRDRILETAVRRIREAFRFPVVSIALADVPEGLLRIVAMASPDLKRRDWGTQPLHSGVAGRAYGEKRTILVPDVSKDEGYIALVPQTRSEVAIPVLSGDEVVAVLNVESDVPAAFKRSQVMTLETLADGIGIILRNADLFEALEGTNARLVELDRMKSELVNIVAHDFRAPLSGVLGYAELLEWKPDGPRAERVEQARSIIQAATHMANLVDKTLKTSRLETGHFPFEFSLMDLSATVQDVLARSPLDGRHPLDLVLPEGPLPCWADPDRVSEVVQNLVSNAVKYSPEGGAVRVEVRADREAAVVRVTDHGFGIAPRDMDRLFRPFSRVRDVRTAEIEGSGLGLYICERIVRAHGGRMWAESEPAVGSTFSFSLPLFGAGFEAHKPLVLVAAGDEATRREVRRVAEGLGYGTYEVADGVDALEAAVRLTPRAVVVDRILPRLRAEEVAERLLETPSTASIPVLALASASDLAERASLFRACLPKPVDRRSLSEALEQLSPAGPRSGALHPS
jgi:signal transduction histidine kinase/DNA-binding response OmpR family regulator